MSVDWAQAAKRLGEGANPAGAVSRAGGSKTEQVRAGRAEAGAWADLVDVVAGARVLLVEVSPSPAAARLAARGAEVVVSGEDAGREAFRSLRWPGTVAGFHSGQRLSDAGGAWDLIVFDDPPKGSIPRLLDEAAALGPARIALVCGNRASALRFVDRLRGGPLDRGGPFGPAAMRRMVRRAGLDVSQVFVLLRSTTLAACAFEARCARVASSALGGIAPYSRGARRGAVAVLRRLAAGRGGEWVAPGWLVVLGGPAPPERRTGRVGILGSREAKVLFGEPPLRMEKRYPTPDAADRERRVLEAIGARLPELVPAVLGAPAPDRLILSWMPGETLPVVQLSDDEVLRWMRRAGTVLRRIHDVTSDHDDGSVFVHGDFWLGNLLVQGESVVGLIDWSAARRGSPTIDIDHLVEHAAAGRPGLRDAMAAAAAEGYADEAACRRRFGT